MNPSPPSLSRIPLSFGFLPGAIRLASLLLLISSAAPSASAYGPLNHLCVVEKQWNDAWSLVTKVFGKNSVPEIEAHQAALAGAMADDLGYYFTGNKDLELLTNAMHYAKSGEWVSLQLRDAAVQRNPRMFAFALGQLSHYAADRMGHSYGTNVVVALSSAANTRLYGWRESYEQDTQAHTGTEAGFDFIAVSNHCGPDLINEIAKSLDLYGKQTEMIVSFLNKELKSLYPGTNLALDFGTVSEALFTAYYLFAHTALEAKELYGLPSPDAKLLSYIDEEVRGFFKYRKRDPNSNAVSNWLAKGKAFASTQSSSTESIFAASFDTANRFYAELLGSVGASFPVTGPTRFSLPDANLDTNLPSFSGVYRLADQTIEELLIRTGSSPKMDCPPQSALFSDYFYQGRHLRSLLTKPLGKTDAAGLHKILEEVGEYFQHVHGATASESIPSLDRTIQYTLCPQASGCAANSAGTTFPRATNIVTAAGVVSYPPDATAADLWMASLAATILKENKGLAAAETWSRTIIGEYRLDDLRNNARDDSFYSSTFCN